jgi:hypothetical protein
LQPDKAKAACKIASLKATPDAQVDAFKQKLNACKALLAKGPANPGDPGGAGNAGDPGAGGVADGQGGGGKVQPPANQCVDVALDDKVPEPAQAGKLALSKNPAAGKCTATGGGCDFVVTVFNPDPAVEFNGPVEFTDHISQPDGSPFPNVTIQTPINPQADKGITGGSLVCKKNGNDVTCSSLGASLKIPPGKKIVVPMSFTPGTDTVAKAVKNCASLPGGEQQCATIPFADNGPLLRAKKIAVGNPETCVPNCEFIIQLSNVGTSDAQGPFVLKDVFSAANGIDSFKMIGDSKFACSSTNGTIGCISTNGGTNKLAPGEVISGFMLVDVKSVSPEYKNCVSYDPAAQAKPSPFDPDAGPLCATIKDTAHQGPNLLIGLTAPNAGPDGIGECAINSPCRFSVLVRSNGAVDFPERARFFATVSPNVPQSLKTGDGRWICSPNANGKIECSDGIQGKILAVGNQLPGEIEVIAGPGWQKNAILTMCVEIRPASLASDTNPADNLSCKSVKLDPFNVKVSKTGDQTCAPGGDCHFTINLFNPGPIDHNAPVTITDQLKGLASAQILSIKPPLPCASQPTQIPFSCTSPDNVCLDFNGKPGEKCGPQTFEMVVRLPNDANAEQFSNCASVTDGEKHRSDDEACHTVSLNPKTTETPPPPASQPARQPLPPAVAECVRGMVLIEGLCQCPPGSAFNGRRCMAGPGSGGAYPIQSQTDVPRPQLVCPPRRPNGVYPDCCPRDMEFKFGACRLTRVEPPPPIRVCPPRRPNGVYPDCCPRGMEFKFGACRSIHVESPPPIRVCPPRRPNGVYPDCCPRDMEFKYGACRHPTPTDNSGGGTNGTQNQETDRNCPLGTHKVRRPGQRGGGICLQDHVEPSRCPDKRPVGTPPNCCPQGTAYRMGSCYADHCPPGMIGRPPRCRPVKANPTPTPAPTPTGPTPKPVPQQPKCSGDKILSSSGQCVCPGGTKDVGHNQCGSVVR